MFIIVGIAILLSIALGVVAWNIINSEKPPEDQNKKEVNVELKPINNLIESCMQSTTNSVLENIGLHGGYYETSAYLTIPDRPTETKAFEPFPGLVIPYWNYMASPNRCTDCGFSSEQPPLLGDAYPAIQAQARDAIETEMKRCINDFAGLENRYIITPRSEPKVTLVFADDSTIVNLDYKIVVQTEASSVTTLTTFTTQVDIPFKRIYEYADRIRKTATSSMAPFFEGLTVETITLESNDLSIPPPFGPMTITFDPGPIWTLFETRSRVAAALERTINMIQVLGSKDMNFVYTSDTFTNLQYANYYFSPANPEPDITVHFLYLSLWTPYIAIHPGGQVLRADMQSSIIPLIPPVRRIDFQYDVSYPILTQLQVPTKNGKFLFQFPFEVNVRNNNPLSSEPIEVQQPDFSFCDPSLATGALINITIAATDGTPVSPELRYECLANSCVLGTARYGKLNNIQLPSCIGGDIVAEREGYKSVTKPYDSISGTDEIRLSMQKLTRVKIVPTMRYLQRQGDSLTFAISWGLSTHEFDVDVPYEAVVTFTPRDDESLTQVATYPVTGSGYKTMDLYPGVYNIDGVVMKQMYAPHVVKGVNIPERPEWCRGGIIFGLGEECPPIQDIVLGNRTSDDPNEPVRVYVGGLTWNEYTNNITITQDMLDRGTLTVPLVVVDLEDVNEVIRSIDDNSDMEVFDQIEEKSRTLSLS